ncbi:MAG: succinate dehydrogenase assembly factor 2 [Pseudomonadota bacterium]
MEESTQGEETKPEMEEAASRSAPESDARAEVPAGTGSSIDAEHRRMRWASRRGMLELDLILEPFVRDAYTELTSDDRERYRELMLSQDQELFAWFLKREVPEDPELALIVGKILSYTREQAPR